MERVKMRYNGFKEGLFTLLMLVICGLAVIWGLILSGPILLLGAVMDWYEGQTTGK